jgi:hypothetical protein
MEYLAFGLVLIVICSICYLVFMNRQPIGWRPFIPFLTVLVQYILRKNEKKVEPPLPPPPPKKENDRYDYWNGSEPM